MNRRGAEGAEKEKERDKSLKLVYLAKLMGHTNERALCAFEVFKRGRGLVDYGKIS